jgi:L-lactate dehydrogenase complex protein LldG
MSVNENARGAILRRIRQALEREAPEPHGWPAPAEGPVFPLPATRAERASRFRSEFEAIHGEWHEVSDVDAARVWLAQWREEQGLVDAMAVDDPLVRDEVGQGQAQWIDASFDARQVKDVPLGITPCESLVAESGSIVVSSALPGRASTILPPIHLVIARVEQIVPDIETSISLLRQKYGSDLPSTASWITGPSRTADIEKILVLGAHGPKRLVLVVIGRLD